MCGAPRGSVVGISLAATNAVAVAPPSQPPCVRRGQDHPGSLISPLHSFGSPSQSSLSPSPGPTSPSESPFAFDCFSASQSPQYAHREHIFGTFAPVYCLSACREPKSRRGSPCPGRRSTRCADSCATVKSHRTANASPILSPHRAANLSAIHRLQFRALSSPPAHVPPR